MISNNTTLNSIGILYIFFYLYLALISPAISALKGKLRFEEFSYQIPFVCGAIFRIGLAIYSGIGFISKSPVVVPVFVIQWLLAFRFHFLKCKIIVKKTILHDCCFEESSLKQKIGVCIMFLFHFIFYGLAMYIFFIAYFPSENIR